MVQAKGQRVAASTAATRTGSAQRRLAAFFFAPFPAARDGADFFAAVLRFATLFR